jgi:hypothetical protein
MRIYNFTINKRLEQSSETNTKEKHQFNKYLLDIGEGNEKSFKSKNGDEVIKLPDDICMDFTKA